MSTYKTEEEQVEAIKNWWKENGKSVIGGIVLGFAIIGGWQGWQGYQRNQGEAASAHFDAMRQAVRSGQQAKAIEDGKRLIGEYGGTAYASFAALELARLAYLGGEKAAAREHLQWVTESAPDPAIREVARLRLSFKTALAEGVVRAVKELDLTLPLVVRLSGTNVEEGRRILSDSGLDLITAVDLKDAAQKVAAIVKE